MNAIDEILSRGVTQIIDEKDLREKLDAGKKLRIKFGVDPTGPRIHLGRAVPFWKLRKFQDMGHTIVFLIGDFTARIGDASDKTSERPMLTKEDVEENLQGYLAQVGKILDISRCEVVYNSDWLSRLTFEEVSRLADCFSVAEMLDRDNFAKRYSSGERISLREFMYPLMQGYDSVVVRADLEIGGNDQYFNLMAGRTIQKKYGQAPQNIITFEFLVGLDGRKMSTSWGNGIFITDEPQEMFGKVMTLHDELIIDYFRLATEVSMEQIEEYRKDLSQGRNPKELKELLGLAIVRRYYDQDTAEETLQVFRETFSQGQIPDEMPDIHLKADNLLTIVSQAYDLSRTEARRVIEQKGIKFGGKEVHDDITEIIKPGEYVIKKGKRHWVKLIVSSKSG
jgi:tyrosyl-tRNA synthetase